MNILLASDGSRYSLAAARFLSHWVPGKGKSVDLVAVAPKAPPSSHRNYRKPKPSEDLWKGALGKWIEDAADPLESRGYSVTSVPESGASAASRIVERAERKDYDLVVVGAKGRSEMPSFDVGSVALSVLEHAPTSVLLVREREAKGREEQISDELHPFRVLFPVDGDDHTLRAIREFLSLMQIPEVVVRIVTALRRSELDAAETLGPSDSEELLGEARKEARRRLNQAENFFRGHGVPTETELLEGFPEEAVLDDAREWEADLLVMGSRGTTDPEGTGHGQSSAIAIARAAPTSVLLVRRA